MFALFLSEVWESLCLAIFTLLECCGYWLPRAHNVISVLFVVKRNR